jgi:hypothetical protein
MSHQGYGAVTLRSVLRRRTRVAFKTLATESAAHDRAEYEHWHLHSKP